MFSILTWFIDSHGFQSVFPCAYLTNDKAEVDTERELILHDFQENVQYVHARPVVSISDSYRGSDIDPTRIPL